MFKTILDFIDSRWIIQIVVSLIIYGIWLFKNYFTSSFDKFLAYVEHATVPEKHENGIVYLYQFRCTSLCPNNDPFCLKIEAFLKYHNISYVPVYAAGARSRNGLLPYIVYNGREISDAQVIISFLEEEFKIKSVLNKVDTAVARAAERTVDNSVYNALTYFRFIKNKKKFIKHLEKIVPFYLVHVLYKLIYYPVKERLEGIHFAQLPEADIYKGLELDLRALDEILGNKKYLFGNEPTPADFGLFAQLKVATCSFCTDTAETMMKKFPKLQNFVDEMTDELYPRYSKKFQ